MKRWNRLKKYKYLLIVLYLYHEFSRRNLARAAIRI